MQPEFLAQRSALEELVYSRGHLGIMSVKCHPEMAGNGIEYAWGMAKLQFRRRFNDLSTKNQAANVAKSLSTESVIDKNGTLRGAPLGITRVRKYARHVRTYRNLYRIYGRMIRSLAKELKVTGFAFLEAMVKKISTHRNICELDRTYLKKDLSDDDEVAGESEDGGADSGRDTDGPEDEEVDEHEC